MVQVITGHLDNPDSWDCRAEDFRPDLCFHLAWYTEPERFWTSEENLQSVASTIRFANYLATVGCMRLVITGTCAEYDLVSERLSENNAVKPRSLYAAAKLAAYLIVDQIAAASELELTWARLFHIFGPYEDARRLVPSIIRKLLLDQEAEVSEGEQIRDYLHVVDVVEALVAVAESGMIGVVNIGSGEPVMLNSIIRDIGSIIGKPELIRFGAIPYSEEEAMFICANNQRLTRNTRWEQQFDLKQGLRNTIEW